MRRKTNEHHSWSLDASHPLSVPNARILLALCRCVRRLPGAFPDCNFDDLGNAIAPVLEELRTPLATAFSLHTKAAAAKGQHIDDTDLSNPVLLHDRKIHTLLGKSLANAMPYFRSLFDKAEQKLTVFVGKHSHPSDQNVETLASMLALSAPEVAYLRLATAFCYGTVERDLFSFVNTNSRLFKVIETLFEVRGLEAVRMFDADRALPRAGLLEYYNRIGSKRDLDDRLCLSAVGTRLLSAPFSGPAEMAAAVLTPLPAQASALRLEWPHLQTAQSLLAAALKEALAQGLPGFNVLLHGAPGTGKTECARQLIAEIGATGFAVDHIDDQGDEAARSDIRLAA
jgi:hypothetical protein